jgi:hypothetical protein
MRGGGNTRDARGDNGITLFGALLNRDEILGGIRISLRKPFASSSVA